MNWDKVDKHLAHIDLPDHKVEELHKNYEQIDFDFNGKKVLDYGCGGGYFADWIHKRYLLQEYLGYDISTRSVKACKDRGYEATNILPFHVYFDVIVCLAVVQHMDNAQLKDFHNRLQFFRPKHIVLQFRHSHKVEVKDDLVRRYSTPEINISGYDIVKESKVNIFNNYKTCVYELKGKSDG